MRKPVVLIIGPPDDACARMTHQALLLRGAEVIWFDERQLLGGVGLRWSVEPAEDDGFVEIGTRRFTLSALTGVLVRNPPRPLPAPTSTSKDSIYLSAELQSTLYAFLNSLKVTVINRPTKGVAHRMAVSSVEAPEAIRTAGFKLPRVLLTADAGDAAAFRQRCGDAILFRPPSGFEPWRRLDDAAELGDLWHRLELHPLYLQELPPGQWLRILVAGGQCFAVAGAGLYPGDAEAELGPAHLTAAMQQQCVQLARGLGLGLAQIDLLRAPDGELVCLDVSAWPEYERCGPELQRSIAEALADRLLYEEMRGSDDPGIWGSGRHRDGVRLLAPVVPAS
jgi:hypothetical protein